MAKFENKFGYLGGEMFLPLQQIGSGGYGVVYLCKSLDTSKTFAVKVEDAKSGGSLINEKAILEEINGIVEGIPKFKWFLSTPKHNILVMELLGESVSSIQKRMKDWKLPLKVVIDVGLQCLNILESIHSVGYIHGDIKPSNLLYGCSESNREKLYVVDFGCSSKFKTTSGSHKRPSSVDKLIGTLLFASTTAHEFILQSRRDDLVSLGYTLIYLYCGSLPWMYYCGKLTPANVQEIYKLKKQFIASFPKDTPSFLKKFMMYSILLLYADTPNYDYLRCVLKSSSDESI